MDFVSSFDKQYDPLADCKLMGDRVNKQMTHFSSIMEVLNEKKTILIKNNLDKAREFLNKLAIKPVVNPGQYTFQKKEGYTVVRQGPVHKEEPSRETANLPGGKRQKIEERPNVYSPSQSPLRLDDEKIVRRELRQEGEQGNIIITPTKLQKNVPQEPLEPVLDLTMVDYRGNKIDPT